MVYSPPDRYHHNPAVVMAQVKDVDVFGPISHLIYKDGSCTCVCFKLYGRCRHVDFAQQQQAELNRLGQEAVQAWLDGKPYGEPLPEPRTVEVQAVRPFWTTCDCMGAELGKLPSYEHDEDCPFFAYAPAAAAVAAVCEG